MGRTLDLWAPRNHVDSAASRCRHKGLTLLEQLAAVEQPKRLPEKPLRVVLFAVKTSDDGTLWVCQGRIEYGTMRLGSVRPSLSTADPATFLHATVLALCVPIPTLPVQFMMWAFHAWACPGASGFTCRQHCVLICPAPPAACVHGALFMLRCSSAGHEALRF